MKKFIKRIDWKKFIKHELYCLLILVLLYVGSITNGRNIPPENLLYIPLIMFLWGVMLLVAAFSNYMEEKAREQYQKNRNKTK